MTQDQKQFDKFMRLKRTLSKFVNWLWNNYCACGAYGVFNCLRCIGASVGLLDYWCTTLIVLLNSLLFIKKHLQHAVDGGRNWRRLSSRFWSPYCNTCEIVEGRMNWKSKMADTDSFSFIRVHSCLQSNNHWWNTRKTLSSTSSP